MSNTPVPPEIPAMPAHQEKNSLATASLVLGLLGFIFLFLTGIPAIITGHIALSRIKASGGTLEGGGKALAGTILGYVTSILIFGLAILAGLATPAILKAKKKAEFIKMTNQVVELSHEFNNFHTVHDSLPNDELAVKLNLPEYQGPRVLEQMQRAEVTQYLTVRKSTEGDWIYNAHATWGEATPLLISPMIDDRAVLMNAEGVVEDISWEKAESIIEKLPSPPVIIPAIRK